MEDGQNRIILKGECNIYSAAGIKSQLQQLLSSNSDVFIDLSEVTLIDSSVIQLLMYANEYQRHRDKKMLLQAPSDIVSEQFSLLNLENQFDIIQGHRI